MYSLSLRPGFPRFSSTVPNRVELLEKWEALHETKMKKLRDGSWCSSLFGVDPTKEESVLRNSRGWNERQRGLIRPNETEEEIEPVDDSGEEIEQISESDEEEEEEEEEEGAPLWMEEDEIEEFEEIQTGEDEYDRHQQDDESDSISEDEIE